MLERDPIGTVAPQVHFMFNWRPVSGQKSGQQPISCPQQGKSSQRAILSYLLNTFPAPSGRRFQSLAPLRARGIISGIPALLVQRERGR
jgi:hypothetical protein